MPRSCPARLHDPAEAVKLSFVTSPSPFLPPPNLPLHLFFAPFSPVKTYVLVCFKIRMLETYIHAISCDKYNGINMYVWK